MPIFAAIDIGSNSCRLKIASVEKHRLKTLHEDREVTRLGASVFAAGVISPESMAATIRALKRFHKATQTYVVDRVRVVATSAMRDARNAPAFTEWVKAVTGWQVEVISGLEEGRLIHLGVVTHEPGTRARCMLIDLGGGSCEIMLSDRGRNQGDGEPACWSHACGKQEFLRDDPSSKGDIRRLKQFIDRELTRGVKKLGLPRVSVVIATSGTAAALAEASATMSAKKPAKNEASRKAVRKLADKLAKMSNEQRADVPGIGPRRSEIVIGGAQVYASLLERFGLKGFRYSPLGLRDGLLEQMLATTDVRASVHRKLESDRWAGVLEICKRYNVDLNTVEPVREHVAQLFDAMEKVHELPQEYRLWLEAAAMMHDVGKFMNHQGRHRHTQYIIANSEMFGFSPEQRAIVSAIARYVGKSRPDAMDRVMRAVPVEEQMHVTRAAVLLRLAVALNQDRASAVVRLKTTVYPKRVVLDLVPGRGGAELEAWSLKKESDYFREVFRRELLVEVA